MVNRLESAGSIHQIPLAAWQAFRCPYCASRLQRTETGAACTCGEHFAFDSLGALDLRPTRRIDRTIQFRLGEPPNPDTHLTFERLATNPKPEVDLSEVEVPHHFTAEMLSYFPRAASDESMILDLGCGNGLHRSVCETAGFQWVGIDIESVGSPILADAHCLPFADDSFDAILSAAVLEHVQYPFVMLEEARRVLKSGGRFIGTVAFLEPYHGSFYHHSHLAVWTGLKQAGFTVEAIAPNAEWPVLRAQAEMSLFPKMPAPLAWSMVRPINACHRLWWRLGRLVNPKSTETVRIRDTAGSFIFIAHA